MKRQSIAKANCGIISSRMALIITMRPALPIAKRSRLKTANGMMGGIGMNKKGRDISAMKYPYGRKSGKRRKEWDY
jgi:hypothetical protein